MDVITKPETELSKSASAAASLLPVSVIIPVRNEARNLPRCLESLKESAKYMSSIPAAPTKRHAIAESYGAKVIQFHYAGGWPKKRQWAMDTLPLAYDWILLLDADEALTPNWRMRFKRRCKT